MYKNEENLKMIEKKIKRRKWNLNKKSQCKSKPLSLWDVKAPPIIKCKQAKKNNEKAKKPVEAKKEKRST